MFAVKNHMTSEKARPLFTAIFIVVCGMSLMSYPIFVSNDQPSANDSPVAVHVLPILAALPDISLIKTALADTNLNLEIPIPGMTNNTLTVCSGTGDSLQCNGLANYIITIYKWLIGAVGIVAVAAIMYAGFLWLTAGGNSGNTTKAREVMMNSLVGLALTLGSYLILYTINPELTQFKSLNIQKVKTINIDLSKLDLTDPNITGTSAGPAAGGTGGIPLLIQKRKNTCAITSLAMVMQGLTKNTAITEDLVLQNGLSSALNK